MRYSLHTRDVQHVGQSGPVDVQQLEEKHEEKQLKMIKSNLNCSISAVEIMFNLEFYHKETFLLLLSVTLRGHASNILCCPASLTIMT